MHGLQVGAAIWKKLKLFIFHLVLHLIALSLLQAYIIGIYAIVKYHHDTGTVDMCTLHSWIAGISY